MVADRLRRIVRLLTPRAWLRSLRLARTLALRGPARADARGLCVDAEGDPIPWLTYPAIDFLGALDFSGAALLEFGCGASTLWWARRARSVVAVELDASWYGRMASLLPDHVELLHVPDGGRYPRIAGELGRRFDVVVIDGAERHRCARESLPWLASDGLLVLDNSDWYPNTARWLREAGLVQIDFVGFGPLNTYPWATSLFARPECAWLARHADRLPPVPGGARIPGGALDDAQP